MWEEGMQLHEQCQKIWRDPKRDYSEIISIYESEEDVSGLEVLFLDLVEMGQGLAEKFFPDRMVELSASNPLTTAERRDPAGNCEEIDETRHESTEYQFHERMAKLNPNPLVEHANIADSLDEHEVTMAPMKGGITNPPGLKDEGFAINDSLLMMISRSDILLKSTPE
jgi:hypothetical protein